MVNEKEFTGRLQQIMEFHGISAATFAETIGVQRSGISHLLSGRNKPSLEFVLKVVRAFPEVDLYWLLNGKGTYPTKTKSSASIQSKHPSETSLSEKQITRVLLFYDDGSFESWDHS